MALQRLEFPANEAPWGHDGLPTVREAASAYRWEAVFVFFFSAFVSIVIFNWMRPAYAKPAYTLLVPTLWWLLMFGAVRGWVDFD